MLDSARPFFCSWSGGKDSCLALHRTMSAGIRPAILLTMMVEDGSRSRSHGLPVSVLAAQASSIGTRLETRSTSWSGYEEAFSAALSDFAARGILDGVFGDIDLAEHREWVERVCGMADVTAHEPLWQGSREKLLREFIEAGYTATVVAVKDGVLERGLLGRGLDLGLVDELVDAGVDASGERGEYHTVVTDGPIFSKPIRLVTGDSFLKGGYWFLDVYASEWPEGWGGGCHA